MKRLSKQLLTQNQKNTAVQPQPATSMDIDVCLRTCSKNCLFFLLFEGKLGYIYILSENSRGSRCLHGPPSYAIPAFLKLITFSLFTGANANFNFKAMIYIDSLSGIYLRANLTSGAQELPQPCKLFSGQHFFANISNEFPYYPTR